MTTIHKGISPENVQTGDVLLCYAAEKGPLARRISKVTGSNYTHAAICVGDGTVAGAGRQQIEIEPLLALVAAFDHVAVFRQPDAWSVQRRKVLAQFARTAVSKGARYNTVGLKKFETIRDEHDDTVHAKLTAFFEGTFEPAIPKVCDAYTCSEFVAACFIVTGFIEPSAAVLYNPGAIAPGDLGKDPTWGTFVGYVSLKDGYDIPVTDEFYDTSTYNEIFAEEIRQP